MRLLGVFFVATIAAPIDATPAAGSSADVKSPRQICPLQAQLDCNGTCFDPTKKRCIAGTLCEPYQDAVCQGKCFSSLEQQCLGGRLCRRSTGARAVALR
jgi:hypothetical protein